MVKDPKKRKDGRCAACRKTITTKARTGVPPMLYEVDPFCSSVCARKYHKVPMPTMSGKIKDKEVSA